MPLPQASQPDELTIDEQEMLEVIEDGDMEDWVKVHKYTHVAVTQMCLSVTVTTAEALSHKLCVLHPVRLLCLVSQPSTVFLVLNFLLPCMLFSCYRCTLFHSLCVCVFQARNKTGHVGYVPEKYLQFPTSNSLLSMLQSLATLDARSHTSSNSTEPELHSGCINGDTNSKYTVNLMIVNYS